MEQNEKENKKSCGWLCSIIIASILILVVAVIFAFVQSKMGLQLNVNDTILMFVGILATFIVVSNYAQVKEIEEKMQKQIEEIKNNLKYSKEYFMNTVNYDLDKMRDKTVSYKGIKIKPREGTLRGIVLSVNDEVRLFVDDYVLPIKNLSELIIDKKPIDNLEQFELYVQNYIKEHGPVGDLPHSY